MGTNPQFIVPPWRPLKPLVTSKQGERSPHGYRDVLSQFDVLHNPRYHARGGKTYCNIYVWDCTLALSCELPHWLNGLEASTPGVGRETTANVLLGMLLTGFGGWVQCDEFDAELKAGRGHPVVAAWQNPSGPGHIAMVLTGPEGKLHIAQAGRVNLFDAPLASGFGQHTPLLFWHE